MAAVAPDGWVILDEKEAEAVHALREALSDLAGKGDATHNLDNKTLVRFLRARRHKVKAAEKLFRSTHEWREKVNPIHLAQTFDAADVIRKYRPGGFLGRDKDGCPVFWDRIGQVDIGIIKHVTPQELSDYEVQKQEVMTEVFRQCSEEAGKEIYQMTIVQDLSGLGMHQLTTQTLKVVEAILGVLDNYYPMRMRKLYIVHPPMIFSVAWSLVKYMVHETTREQVVVISGNPVKGLEKHIDRSQIPEALGGDLRINGDPYCNPPIVAAGRIPKDFSGEPSRYRDDPSGIPVHLFVPPRSSVRMDKTDVDAALANSEPPTILDMFQRTVTLVTEWVRDLTDFQIERPEPEADAADEEDTKSRHSMRTAAIEDGAPSAKKLCCCVIS